MICSTDQLKHLGEQNLKRLLNEVLVRIKNKLDRIAIEEIKEKLYIAEIN